MKNGMEKKLFISCTIAQNVPRQVVGDVQRLKQIATNLLNNAVKFTNHGGITIDVKTEKATAENLVLRLAITDTGIGIAEGDHEKLFKAFSQVSTSFSRRYDGAGLGLSICKTLCEKMGGGIGLTSTVGSGSTFFFTVKIKKSCANKPVDAA